MSEFKFFCLHCGQCISCDAGYAGRQTQCPACQGELVVPSAADSGHRLRLAPAGPRPARPQPQYPLPGIIEPWTEEAWAKHERAIEERQRPQLSPWVRVAVVLLLISPSIVALFVTFVSRHWKSDDLYGLFLILLLFTIVVAAVATYVFEGSGPYLDESWDPGGGVLGLLLVLGGLSVLLGGDYPIRPWSWGSGRPWTWTRFWIGAVTCVNLVVVFCCWLT